jgi:hypothetical protein
MEEEKQKTYINAIVLETGDRIKVTHAGKGSPYFFDEEAGRFRHIETLDLSEPLEIPLKTPMYDPSDQMKSLTEIMKTFDMKAQDEHRAVIAEREYWRTLRGNVLFELLRNSSYRKDFVIKSKDDLLNDTKYIVNQLWQQDHDFFFNKKVFSVPVE